MVAASEACGADEVVAPWRTKSSSREPWRRRAGATHKITQVGSSITVTAVRLRINPGLPAPATTLRSSRGTGRVGVDTYLSRGRHGRAGHVLRVGVTVCELRPPARVRRGTEGWGLVDWDVVGVGCSKTSMNTQFNLRNTWSKT